MANYGNIWNHMGSFGNKGVRTALWGHKGPDPVDNNTGSIQTTWDLAVNCLNSDQLERRPLVPIIWKLQYMCAEKTVWSE